METRINAFRAVVSDWLLKELPEVKERDINIPTNTNKVVTIIGPRRAGKTFLMYSVIKKLNKEMPRSNILYINFEDDRLMRITVNDLRDLLTIFYELAKPEEDKPIYLFLDEIQLVSGWDIWVRRMTESNQFKIYISGSSSKLLSREIATSLRGRSIDYLVLPFSFREFLSVTNNIKKDPVKLGYSEKRGLLLNSLRDYLINGGYPEVVMESSKDIKIKILDSYYNTVFYKDLAERFNVKNLSVLDAFLKYLVSSYAKYVSITKIYRFLNSLGYKTSKKTLLDLLSFSSQVFFAFPLELISRSAKKRAINPKKIYIVDNGVMLATRQEISLSRLMENACFLELLRRKERENFDIAYWKEYGRAEGKEVDFIVYDSLKVRQLIQVSYTTKKEEVNLREKVALLAASKELKCNNLLIITWDYTAEEKIKGKKIRFIPLWKWLLNV